MTAFDPDTTSKIMPRPPSKPSVADLSAAQGGVAAVDRAISLLTVFTTEEPNLNLTEIAERTQLYKSTVLRLLASLECAGLTQRMKDGRYALGPAIAKLHSVYASSFSMEQAVVPALQRLVDITRESAAFYVRQGEQRLCLYRVDSPRPVRDHQKAGDILPLDRGAGGRVISAYSGAKGPIYSRIRKHQSIILVGDRLRELAAIGAPVFGAHAEFVGALTLIMPSERMDEAFEEPVRRVAREITTALGGQYPAPVR
jgi:DNA-binding IclR family transcriptional regulator